MFITKMIMLTVGVLMLAGTESVMAQHHGYYRGHSHGYNWHPQYGWVIPSVIGGVIVYEVMRNQAPPPVIIQQPPVIIQQSTPAKGCTDWHETQQPDGKITRERTCYQN